MATGTVVYRSDRLNPHREIYNGASAQKWKMTVESGSFPNAEYKITSAKLKIDIRNVYAADRHMVVSREDGEQLGDVPTSKTGVQELNLLTSASYSGIKEIKTDGVTRWACQLRGGSYIYIIVSWEETQPDVKKPTDTPEPVVITGIESSGEKGKALRTEVGVSFDGVDISQPINAGLISLSYTDNEEDEADDLQIKVEDRKSIWLTKWLNDTMAQAAYGIKKGTKGLTISAGVKQLHPDGLIRSADFGLFELDTLKASAPPSQILIKGTSLPYSNGVRTEERNKSWDNYSLKKIGQEIASKAGLGFIYDCPNDPSYTRVEQAKQTDIAFLQQLCHDHGYSLKVSGMKMIIFDQARYENMKAFTTIQRLDGSYTKYDLQTQDGETHYDQCRVVYYDALSGKKYEAFANAEDYDAEANEHTVCTVTNRAVSSNEEAADLAAKILRLHNKYEKKVTFTLIGNPMLGAGMAIMLKDFGMWDEKYIIKTAKHEIGPNGYTTKIILRSIPEGNVATVKIEEEEKKQSNSSRGSNKSKRTEPHAKRDAAVYKTSTGNKKIGVVLKGQKLNLRSNISNSRRAITFANGIGYISVSAIEWVEVKAR